jgi:two-component system, NarL family, nitrate/nitrite response regulator NarL
MADSDGKLTTRQRAVLKLIAQGLTYKAVARRLHVEPSTVRTHLNDLHHRLGSTNAPHAVYIAVTRGLID